ncbi:MAG: patatin-like phospholipase family protein [Trueperaceae bacterium]
MVLQDKTFGLALGGGAARAFSQIGVLKVLEREGLYPKVLAGTSSGAFMAANYALGTPALELEKAMLELDVLELWSQAFDFGLHKAAFIDGKRFTHWLDRKFFHGATFADTLYPLVIACMDIETGGLVLMRKGSLAQAVMASSSLSVIFAPVNVGKRYLIDGGFVATVPFPGLAALGVESQHMLGIHAGIDAEASPFIRGVRTWYGSSSKRWQELWLSLPAPAPYKRLSQSLLHVLASYQQGVSAPPGARLLQTRPPVAWWDFHKSLEAIRAGERAMQEELERQEAEGRRQKVEGKKP